MATIVTVACDNITKKCTGKITGNDATLTDQGKVNSWLNSINTVNSKLPSAESGSVESSESSAESSAESEPPVGSANSLALVQLKQSPVVKALDTQLQQQLTQIVLNQPKPVQQSVLNLISLVPANQALAQQAYIRNFLDKPSAEQNIILNKLLENKPSNLSQALVLREGGRKTRTSHKRRKASKKTRKAQ